MSEKRARLILLLAGSLLGLLMAEATLRLIRPPQLGITRQPCIYLRDEVTGYRHRPGASGLKTREFEIENMVRINSWGFHDVEPQSREADPFPVVAVLGDSFTAALEVDVSQGWTQTLERELRRRGYPRAAVYNFGLNGTGTKVQLTLFERHLPRLQPDLVLLAFYKNDIKDVSSPMVYKECYRGCVLTYISEEQRTFSKTYVDRHWPGPLVSWLYDKSFMFRAAALLSKPGVLLQSNNLNPSRLGIPGNGKDRKGGKSVKGAKGGKGPRPGVMLKQAFRRFTRLGQKHGYRFIVLPVPTKTSLTGSLDVLGTRLPAVRSLVSVLDAAPVLEQLEQRRGVEVRQDLYWTHDGHFNVLGNRLFGESVAELLVQPLAALEPPN